MRGAKGHPARSTDDAAATIRRTTWAFLMVQQTPLFGTSTGFVDVRHTATASTSCLIKVYLMGPEFVK
jgi:hypothetical protein